MRIAVIGTGAVGGYFGGRLAEAGEEVVFVARGKILEALRKRGLVLDSPQGNLHLEEVQATSDLASIGQVDAVLVGVKSWQVPEVAASLRPLVGAATSVLPLQNGVEAPDQLSEALGAGVVLGAMCKVICQVVEPGYIRDIGTRPYVALGELDNRRTERVERLRAALERAGVVAEVPPDIRGAMWSKFLFITAMSGLGAVTRVPLGALRSTPETREMLENAMREVTEVAAGLGIALAPEIVEETMSFVDRLPEDATSSMQRDIMEGRPSELEAQNGAVVRLGKKAGVPTPTQHFFYHCLMPMERAARSA